MVTTRSHADGFSAPSAPPPPSPTSKSRSSTGGAKRWSHTPTPLTLVWLFVSIPLVTWDTLYVLLRPHTMPGGYLHAPVWKGYALYGSIDYVYGWPAFEANDGFTAAQASLNVVETLGYLVYLWMVWREGGRDGTEPGMKGRLGERVEGGWAAAAVLAGFAFSVMTLSKTVLYGELSPNLDNLPLGHRSRDESRI